MFLLQFLSRPPEFHLPVFIKRLEFFKVNGEMVCWFQQLKKKRKESMENNFCFAWESVSKTIWVCQLCQEAGTMPWDFSPWSFLDPKWGLYFIVCVLILCFSTCLSFSYIKKKMHMGIFCQEKPLVTCTFSKTTREHYRTGLCCNPGLLIGLS